MNKNTKEIFKKHKVCFVTNDPLLPGGVLYRSLPTYMDVADGNIHIMPGIVNNKPVYGCNAFALNMLPMLIAHGYDYAIYVDNDCFVCDSDALADLFLDFVMDGSVIAGVADGGVVCHRNHNNMMINTFLSFWNLNAVRKYLSDNGLDFINAIKLKNPITRMDFEKFTDLVSQELFDEIDSKTKSVASKCAAFRDGKESSYCATVKNDKLNRIEPHQVPYSYRHDDFEPYYILQEWLVLATNLPIMFMEAYDSDLVDGFKEIDPSGISTVVCRNGVPVACHTWFGREYTRQGKHRDRIIAVAEKTFYYKKTIL